MPFKVMLITTCWHYALQNVAKGVDVYDEMIHYPWLLRLTKSVPVSWVVDCCVCQWFLLCDM